MDFNIYPPITKDYEPAFVANTSVKIHFKLSEFTTISTIKSVQVLVVKQGSNQNMINNATDDVVNRRYRTNNSVIILNRATTNDATVKTDDEGFYIELTNEDVNFYIGGIYKVQIRVSTVDYSAQGGIPQNTWLTLNSDNFSEWSQPCIIKCIGVSTILDSVSSTPQQIDTFEFVGRYTNVDPSENLSSYKLQLLDNSNQILEETPTIQSNSYSKDRNSIQYSFKTILFPSNTYNVKLMYETINKYMGEETYTFSVDDFDRDDCRFRIFTTEYNSDSALGLFDVGTFDTKQQEEEIGIVKLLIYDTQETNFTGTIYVGRTDSKSGFNIWEDLFVLEYDNEVVNDYLIDNTTESGIYYRYRVQYKTEGRPRSYSYELPSFLKRELFFSFLSGKDNTQLCVKYDFLISNVDRPKEEAQIKTIGSPYPFITRTGNANYRTMSISGKISFTMDDNFITEQDLFGTSYQLYSDKDVYNQFRERFFRQKVLDFLQDGEPKLFRSCSEGNVIVNVMDIKIAPNAITSRLICDFNGSLVEVAEDSVDNYKKYNLLNTKVVKGGV